MTEHSRFSQRTRKLRSISLGSTAFSSSGISVSSRHRSFRRSRTDSTSNPNPNSNPASRHLGASATSWASSSAVSQASDTSQVDAQILSGASRLAAHVSFGPSDNQNDMSSPSTALKFPIPDGFFPQIALGEHEITAYKRQAREKLAALLALVEEGDKLYEWNNVPTSKGVVVQQAEGSGVRMSDKSEFHFTMLKSSIEMRGVTAERILEAIAKPRTKEFRNMMWYLHGTEELLDARTLFKFPPSTVEQRPTERASAKPESMNSKDSKTSKTSKTSKDPSSQDKDKAKDNGNSESTYRAIKWFAWRPRVHIEGVDDDIIDFSVLEYAGKLQAPEGSTNTVGFCMQESIVRGRDVPPLTAFGVQRSVMTKCGIVISKTAEEGVLRVTSFAHLDESAPPQLHDVMEDMLRDYVAGVQRLHGLVGSYHVDGLAILSKDRWVSKRERKNCAICGSGFMLHRKHNCRCCGEVVCSACAPVHEVDAAVDGNTAEFRVCIMCVEKTAKMTMNPRLRRKPSATISDRLLFRKPSSIARSRSERASSHDSDSWSQLDRVETTGGSDVSSSHYSGHHGNAFEESMLNINAQFQQEIANLKAADAAREAAMLTMQKERDKMSTRVLELEEAAVADTHMRIANDTGLESLSQTTEDSAQEGKLRMEDLDDAPAVAPVQDAPSSRLHSSLENLSTTIAELRKENDSLTAQLNNTQDGKGVLDARIQMLEETLAASRVDNAPSLREELKAAQEQLEALALESTRKLSSTQSELDSLHFTIECQNRTIADLEEEKATLSGRLENAESSLKVVSESLAQHEKMKEDFLSSSQIKEQSLQSTIEYQLRTISQLENENTMLESRLSTIDEAVDREEAEYLRTTIELLEHDKAELASKVSALEKELADHIKESEELQEELSNLRVAGRQRNEIMASLQQENGALLFLMNKMEKRLIEALRGPREARRHQRGMEILPNEENGSSMIAPNSSSRSQPPIGPAPMSDYARYLAMQELYDCDVAPKTLSPWADHGLVRARSVSAPNVLDIPLSTLVAKVQDPRNAKSMVEGKQPVQRREPEPGPEGNVLLDIGSRMLRRQQLVHFCAFAPPLIDKPKRTFFYAVWAFSANNRKLMLQRAHAADPTCSCLSISDQALLVPHGATVNVTLAAPRGYRVKNGCCQSLVWQGDVACASFIVECTKRAAGGNAAFSTRIAVVGAEEAP